ncbi:MAG: CPXCG motif-containing cysteine-rich protein [Gemmatimonadaceae bacterium]|nr:CPXCG motif-containing cysteine-rich protein [Gemmatimonadaceae bacterium]
MDQPDEWEPVDDEFLEEDVPDDSRARLDGEFPLGDGVADLASVVSCPYCGESVEITLDPGSGGQQDYVEDCAVCCRPWNVSVTYHDDGTADVFVEASDDP